MQEIKYTLLSEGSSDKALLPILNWLFYCHLNECEIQSAWSDLSRLPSPPKILSEKIKISLDLYPCDLLFIHRDADNQGREQRVKEIETALCQITEPLDISVISIIPVRMTEAWLLFNEEAIRMAADNPRGREQLNLPKLKALENFADPKSLLHDILQQASSYSGRRLKQFKSKIGERVYRISELIKDFSPLRALTAFQLLEEDIKNFCNRQC